MTPFGDHLDEMNVTDPVLDDFLDELCLLVDVAAPPPSDELEALFTSSLPLAKRGRPEPSRPLPVGRRLLTPLAVAATVAALLVIGAATHQLPAPAQRLISKVVNTVTPFHIDPDEHPPAAPPSEHPRHGSRAGGTTGQKSAPAHRSRPGRRSPVSGAPNAPAGGSAGNDEAPGHGKAHGPTHGAIHGAVPGVTSGATPGATRGRPTVPGQVGRTGVHGGGRPAPSSPVPSVSVGAPNLHGSGPGNGSGTARRQGDTPKRPLLRGQDVVTGGRRAGGDQYTKSVRKALPKQRSGSLFAASARNSPSRG